MSSLKKNLIFTGKSAEFLVVNGARIQNLIAFRKFYSLLKYHTIFTYSSSLS